MLGTFRKYGYVWICPSIAFAISSFIMISRIFGLISFVIGCVLALISIDVKDMIWEKRMVCIAVLLCICVVETICIITKKLCPDIFVPQPYVKASVDSLRIQLNQRESIPFTITNAGGQSSRESYLTISVSDGIDIVAWNIEPPSLYTTFFHLQPGMIMHAIEGERPVQYETIDICKSYTHKESISARITLRGVRRGRQWIKYRTAFGILSTGYDFIRFPPLGDITDQQGYAAFEIPVIVE